VRSDSADSDHTDEPDHKDSGDEGGGATSAGGIWSGSGLTARQSGERGDPTSPMSSCSQCFDTTPEW
jgi:hypothetical protein